VRIHTDKIERRKGKRISAGKGEAVHRGKREKLVIRSSKQRTT
jgi:hypothetical protein